MEQKYIRYHHNPVRLITQLTVTSRHNATLHGADPQIRKNISTKIEL